MESTLREYSNDIHQIVARYNQKQHINTMGNWLPYWQIMGTVDNIQYVWIHTALSFIVSGHIYANASIFVSITWRPCKHHMLFCQYSNSVRHMFEQWYWYEFK